MEPNEDFHPAVQFLLARIKSHPEDFAFAPDGVRYSNRRGEWSKMYTRVYDDARDTEQAALDRAMKSNRLDTYHQDAMKLALNPPEEQRAMSTTEHYAYGFSDPRAAYGSPTTSGTGLTLGAFSYDPSSNTYRVNGASYTPSQLDDMGLLKIVEQSIRAQQDTGSNNTVRVSTYNMIKNFVGGGK
jgi:hypothetical protein